MRAPRRIPLSPTSFVSFCPLVSVAPAVHLLLLIAFGLLALPSPGAARAAPAAATLLLPDRVFDGVAKAAHPGWAVLVEDGRIVAVGPRAA